MKEKYFVQYTDNPNRGLKMNDKLKKIVFSRASKQTMQGLLVGGYSRAIGENAVPLTALLYGGAKYVFNHELERQYIGISKFHGDPYERHSSLKKIAWYALGVALTRADMIYFALQPMIEKI